MTPDPWADFSSPYVTCRTCGASSPDLDGPDAGITWTEDHICERTAK